MFKQGKLWCNEAGSWKLAWRAKLACAIPIPLTVYLLHCKYTLLWYNKCLAYSCISLGVSANGGSQCVTTHEGTPAPQISYTQDDTFNKNNNYSSWSLAWRTKRCRRISVESLRLINWGPKVTHHSLKILFIDSQSFFSKFFRKHNNKEWSYRYKSLEIWHSTKVKVGYNCWAVHIVCICI